MGEGLTWSQQTAVGPRDVFFFPFLSCLADIRNLILKLLLLIRVSSLHFRCAIKLRILLLSLSSISAIASVAIIVHNTSIASIKIVILPRTYTRT